MSDRRARRRLMAKQRFERHCLLIGAVPFSLHPLWKDSMSRAYAAVERQYVDRWWRRPWMLREPYRTPT